MTGKAVESVKALQRIMGWESTSSAAIDLLRMLEVTGSINSAAKAKGISYKSAWRKLDQLNNLVPYPLVEKQTGGSGGGGTVLTAEGRQLLRQVEMLEQKLHQFVTTCSKGPEEALSAITTLRRLEMQLSARNVWGGQVESIEQGAVNSVVTVQLGGGDGIRATITDTSVRRLDLAPGKAVMAIVKASCVLLATHINPQHISARNILTGTITALLSGTVNDEVTLELSGGSTVTAIVTSASVTHLGLQEGDQVSAVIKASDVLLALG